MSWKEWMCLCICGIMMGGSLWGQAFGQPEIQEVVNLKDTLLQKVLIDPDLRGENWDLQPEIRFWRQAMSLTEDSCILNIAQTREVLTIIPTIWYDTLSDDDKLIFKDSMIKRFSLKEDTRIYVTYGKREYYQFDHILEDIDRGIGIFEHEKVDPWYAQTILLIESPGANRTSYTGARGRFQLMKYVAVQQGLKVNGDVDEREDFERSAQAAAGYIKRVCIPEARQMMKRRGMLIQEEDLWFRLLVMHVYHAGGRNVAGALRQIPNGLTGKQIIKRMWHTHYRGFQNASQNYSQIALAALLELDDIVQRDCDLYCLKRKSHAHSFGS